MLRGSRFRLAFLLFQVFWTVVILPGHVRGMIVMGGCPSCAAEESSTNTPSCCANKKHDTNSQPDENRKAHCALCDNARGYMEIPVFDFDFKPTGLLELCKLIEPTKLHRLLTEPTYFATAPPAATV